MRSDGRERSRPVATWLAVLGGTLGLHRFYLHGTGDLWAWLHPWPTLVGAYGFWRLRQFGIDDLPGSRLVPFLGVMLAISMLAAIVHGLAPAERWRARYGRARRRHRLDHGDRRRRRPGRRRHRDHGDDRLRHAALLRAARALSLLPGA